MEAAQQPSVGKKNGQGIVEFALILPLLLLVIFGLIEAGRLLFIYSAVMTASREAARYGSAAGDVGGGLTQYYDCAGIRGAALRVGTLAGVQNDQILIGYDRGPSLGSIGTCDDAPQPDVNLGDRVVVTVTTPYRTILPIVNLNSFNITSVAARSIMMGIEVDAPLPGATPVVAFTSESQEVNETDENITISAVLRLSHATSLNVEVPISVGGSATPGADYTLGTIIPVEIPAGSTETPIQIIIQGDDLDEWDENIVLTIVTPIVNATKGSPFVHTITIHDDDDMPQVFFSPASGSDDEGNTLALIASLSAPSGKSIDVVYGMAGGDAAEGEDYTITGDLNIPPGSLSSTSSVLIQTIDDNIDEVDETLIVGLLSATNAYIGSPASYSGTIIDNDTALVSFAWDRQNIAENSGDVNILVQLSNPSSRTVRVGFEDVPGSANNPEDYRMISSSPLVFSAGATSANIQLHIESDTTVEGEESFRLRFTSYENTAAGANPQTVVNITETWTPPVVQFAAATSSIGENGGSLSVPVVLSAPSSQPVTVNFNVSGTATQGAGQDYTLSPIPLTIPAGSAGANLIIAVNNDTLDEADNETAILTIGTVTNGTVGAQSVHTASIQDDDLMPSVSFTSDSQRAMESVGSMQVVLQLSAASGRDISLPFTLGGTAGQGAGADYTITPSPLVIPAGSTTASLLITVNQDTDFTEEDETIIITMGAPTNATRGAITVHTATITAPFCPSAPVEPTFGEGSDKKKLVWNIQSAGTSPVRLLQVRVIWPLGSPKSSLTSITFGSAGIGSGYPYDNGNTIINSPIPLWGPQAFTSLQMVFLFDKRVDVSTSNPVTVIAQFEGCASISGVATR